MRTARLHRARSLELVEALPDGPAKAEALNVQGYLRMLDRDNAEAVELARRTIEMGGGDARATLSVVTAWNTLGSARILLGDIDGGRADLDTSIRLAEQHDLIVALRPAMQSPSPRSARCIGSPRRIRTSWRAIAT